MALLYRQGHVADFYWRRARRLLPAYFATVIGTVVVSAFVTLPSEQHQVVEQGIFASLFASNFGFWAQHSYFSKAAFNPLLHLWSIGVEIQFYLLVPAIVWLHRRKPTMLLLLGLAALFAGLLVVTVSPKTSFFMMPLRLWQFLAGFGVAWYFSQGGSVRISRPLYGLAGLGLMLLVTTAYPVNGEADSIVFGHPGLAAVLVTAATCVTLTFGLPLALTNSLPGVVLSKLGDWSYSVYLAHFPVIVLGLYVPFSGTIITPGGLGQLLGLLLAISIFSTVLYLLFDRRRRWPRTVAGLSVVVVVAIVVSVLSGPVSRLRYNTAELNILSAREDRTSYRCGKLNRILQPTGRFCEVTAGLPTSAPILILVGDSHADAIKASVANVAQARGYRLFLTVSNAPLYGSPNRENLVAMAKQLGAKGLILHFAAPNAFRALDAALPGLTGLASSAGLKLAWLLPVPSYERNVPDMMWSGRNQTTREAISPANLEEISAIEQRLLLSNIQVVDPRPVFCPSDCLFKDAQNHPFYHDNSHLTLTGARLLENLMVTTIDSLGR